MFEISVIIGWLVPKFFEFYDFFHRFYKINYTCAVAFLALKISEKSGYSRN